ncbi:MAG TPA: bifunctional oligoribonuclease/PAP phosphatase NrnA [Acholeplasmataceae bacterium]|nr:bifunctional oligoribonuclease/PAP phosphatase NrnA [Acholeplasmataceae bacterium]
MDNLDIKKQILNKIKEYDSIIIVRHQRPDGDCIGSALGLKAILRDTFPKKRIYSISEDWSDYLSFLGSDDSEVSLDVYKKSLIIALDTATKNRISNKSYVFGKEIIKIDHHINVEPYGDINYVREDMPATASMILDFYDSFRDELKMNYKAALCLFTGVVTDTGRFKYSSVNSNTMRLAGEMIDYGIDIEKIYAKLYLRDESSYKLKGYIFNKFKSTENGVAYIYFSQRIQKRFGVSSSEAAALVNSLDSIKGKLIWIIFVEQEDKTIRVRLRSRFARVVEIAQNYNGGGHAQASGATVNNKKEMKELLKEADQILKEFKEKNPELF